MYSPYDTTYSKIENDQWQNCNSQITLKLLRFDHVHDATAFELNDRLHVIDDQFSLDHISNTWLRRRIEIVASALRLFSESIEHSGNVSRRRPASEQLIGHLTKVQGRLLQEGLLEVLLVHSPRLANAKLHQHSTCLLHGDLIDVLAATLSSNQLEKTLAKAIAHGRPANDQVAEEQ